MSTQDLSWWNMYTCYKLRMYIPLSDIAILTDLDRSADPSLAYIST